MTASRNQEASCIPALETSGGFSIRRTAVIIDEYVTSK